jgi:hypothetical protein
LESITTLCEYRDLCALIDGEDSPAVKFFDDRISLHGRDESVVADESQVLALIAHLLGAADGKPHENSPVDH